MRNRSVFFLAKVQQPRTWVFGWWGRPDGVARCWVVGEGVAGVGMAKSTALYDVHVLWKSEREGLEGRDGISWRG